MPAAHHPLARAVSEERRLPIWLTHIWQRHFDHERLGLVLGAGVTYDAGIPMWEELVRRLAASGDVPEQRLELHKKARFPETFLAEILFRKHCADQASSTSHLPPKYRGYHVNSIWKQKIRKCLYEKIENKDFKEITKNHIYLGALAKLICKARFAVTFNFDDIVDQAVVSWVEDAIRAHPELMIANPEIIYHPKVETRKNAPVIYHINGSLPRDELRRSSEHVVLTEDAFADILLSPNSHDAQFVINQFAVRTFLLLGISLSDNSLKNILRASATRNPANHHFIILHEKDSERRSAEERAEIFDVNLHVYNLISIFLTTVEIKAFLETINAANGEEFDKAIQGLVTRKIDRKYYLVGSIAAGKSSTLDGLRCFTTFEEFGGHVPAAMYQNDRTLTPEEQKIVDDYLFPQLLAKNGNMIRMNSGIRIMDRAYLDLFAFSKGDAAEIKRKAVELKTRLKDWGKPMEGGQIFFLKASNEALKERLARRGAKKAGRGKVRFDAKALVKQEKELMAIYRLPQNAVIDTTEGTAGETARTIARTILLDEYHPFDFAARLEEVIKMGGKL
jgi:hypothetical protein